MGVTLFDSSYITDDKRFVRGEQLQLAQRVLRTRDHVHHARWRVLILAGRAPAGEIAAIRELMPKALITAVDIDPVCVQAARDAGADETVHCDLTAWARGPGGSGNPIKEPATELSGRQFDILHLDLCGTANETTRDLVRVYRHSVSSGGVFLLTFSYGRDVVEVYRHALNRLSQDEKHDWCLGRFEDAKVPPLTLGRLAYLFTPGMLDNVLSICMYRGHEMPMCTVLCAPLARYEELSFIKTQPGDFELAVLYPDVTRLYDCPADRLRALRRRLAALRASYTRKLRRDDGTKRSLLAAAGL